QFAQPTLWPAARGPGRGRGAAQRTVRPAPGAGFPRVPGRPRTRPGGTHRRRLEELGRVALDVEHDIAHLDEALAVESLGWKRTAGTAILSAPQTARFYTEVARWAAASW